MLLKTFSLLGALCFAIRVDGKLLTCDEFLDDSTVHDEQSIYSKKCTFSYITFDAFDAVNISMVLVKEIDYDNEVSEVDISDTIEHVEFVNSRFPHLPSEIFVSFKNLKTVTCDGVSLTSLSRTDLKAATNLESFSCNSNYIKSLEKMCFNSIRKLQSLDLSINDIESIDKTAFYGLEKLKKLLLYDNKLQNLSGDVFEDLISLEEINLSSNQLEIVDGKLFENCKLLNYIYLNDNRIQQISDKSLLAIKEIKFLELSNNELVNLTLNISASALYANRNRLTSVRLKSVGYLSFFNNSISEISFDDHNGVISLNLSTNRMSSDSIRKITEMSGMKSLDLSFNNIGTLNVTTFLDMPLLQVLNLQSTNMTDMSFGLFTHQTSLEQLDLSYNGLRTLDLMKLAPLKALTTLFIEGNKISQIDFKSIKTTLPALNLFGFSDNAWSCAYLTTIIAHLEQSKIEIYNLVVEKTKSNVAGIGCSEQEMNYDDKSLSVNPGRHQLRSDSNEMRIISEKLEAALRHANDTSEKFVAKADLINELNMIKSAVASLKQELQLATKQNGRLTLADVRSVANETMMQQKSDYDLKINGLENKVNSIEESVEGIKTQLKRFLQTSEVLVVRNESQRASQLQSTSTGSSYTNMNDILMKLMITTIFVVVCCFTVIYIVRVYTSRRARNFIVKRARTTTECIDENNF